MLVAMKCPSCGGDVQVDSTMTMGKCEYCNSTVIIPKNMEKIGNLYNLATYYRQSNEFDRSIETYKDILKEDSEDAEAYFGLAMSKYGIEFIEDPKSHERIPTFHRTKEKSILNDPDYLKALEYADYSCRSYYQKQGERIALIQNEIIKQANAGEDFDVFICYKESDDTGNRTEESVLGQELYYELEKQGIKTFFARLTLESGVEYEPVIYSALKTAKVMLVLGCNPQNFDSTWVKNEWSRFLELKETDRNKTIIPCYKNCSPYELPKELVMFQALDMNKIGFLQDVITGIRKIISAGNEAKAENAVKETEVDRLCRNAETFLTLGEKGKAEKIYRDLTESHPDDYRGWWGIAAIRTNDFTWYSRDIFQEVSGHVQNAIKVAKEEERGKILPVWEGYFKLREKKEREQSRFKYQDELSKAQDRINTYNNRCKADESKLPQLYQIRTDRERIIKETTEKMNHMSEFKVGRNLGSKANKVLLVVAIILAAYVILSGMATGVGVWGQISSLIGLAILVGLAFVITKVVAGAIDTPVNAKNNLQKKDLNQKYSQAKAELEQVNQEIKVIEQRKKENEDYLRIAKRAQRALKKLEEEQ